MLTSETWLYRNILNREIRFVRNMIWIFWSLPHLVSPRFFSVYSANQQSKMWEHQCLPTTWLSQISGELTQVTLHGLLHHLMPQEDLARPGFWKPDVLGNFPSAYIWRSKRLLTLKFILSITAILYSIPVHYLRVLAQSSSFHINDLRFTSLKWCICLMNLDRHERRKHICNNKLFIFDAW